MRPINTQSNSNKMKFSKALLAAFLGALIAMAAMFFVKLGVFTSIISSLSSTKSETATTVKPNSVLYMKLDYEIPDRSNEDDFSSIDFATMETKDATGLNTILRNIEYAMTDPNIKGIYLELSSIPTSEFSNLWWNMTVATDRPRY